MHHPDPLGCSGRQPGIATHADRLREQVCNIDMEDAAQLLQSFQRDILILIFNAHNSGLRQTRFTRKRPLWQRSTPLPDEYC